MLSNADFLYNVKMMEKYDAKLLHLAVAASALIASASLAMAQDGKTRGETWRSYNYDDGYTANGSMRTGPYVAPRHQPSQPGVPFIWQEKRYFDWSTGEQG